MPKNSEAIHENSQGGASERLRVQHDRVLLGQRQDLRPVRGQRGAPDLPILYELEVGKAPDSDP